MIRNIKIHALVSIVQPPGSPMPLNVDLFEKEAAPVEDSAQEKMQKTCKSGKVTASVLGYSFCLPLLLTQ